jgi:hypothetical protein
MLYHYNNRGYVNTMYPSNNMPSEYMYFYVDAYENQTRHRNKKKQGSFQ